MRILVIGGMHGNEPLGPEVVRMLSQQQNSNIDVLLANEQAIAANTRFVKQDLNRSFPGVATGTDYETKRAAEVLQACQGYDVVFDFHNTHCPDNDCSFVGDTASQSLFDISAWLGLPRVIVADYDCLNKYAPNCISIEISLSSPRMNVQAWIKAIQELSRLDTVPGADNLELYRFAYRMTLADKTRLRLDEQRLEAFKPLPRQLAKAMDVASPAYPIFVGDGYTPYNFGGLLNRINV